MGVIQETRTRLKDHTKYIIDILIEDDTGYSESFQSSVFSTPSNTLSLANFLNGPNPYDPSKGNTHIQYQLSKPADVSLYIFSVTGKLIWKKTLNKGENGGKEGLNSVSWNGKSTAENTVGNGLYICYLVAKDGTTTVKGKTKIAIIK